MATQAARERTKRRKIVLDALKKRGTSEPAHLSQIYAETIEHNQDVKVGEQTIKGDLEYLCRKRPLWDGDRGKVKKIKGKLSWQYLEPKPASFAAYGYRWKRDQVKWKLKRGRPSEPSNGEGKKLEGKKKGKKPVNFFDIAGVYLLHKGDRTIYVGRVQGGENRGLYDRLREHTSDRLKRDWDEFSWFGFNEVGDGGTVSKSKFIPPLIDEDDKLLQLITTIEAVIINGIRPSRNSRGGDLHDDVHYEQVEVATSKK